MFTRFFRHALIVMSTSFLLVGCGGEEFGNPEAVDRICSKLVTCGATSSRAQCEEEFSSGPSDGLEAYANCLDVRECPLVSECAGCGAVGGDCPE